MIPRVFSTLESGISEPQKSIVTAGRLGDGGGGGLGGTKVLKVGIIKTLMKSDFFSDLTPLLTMIGGSAQQWGGGVAHNLGALSKRY